MSDVMAVMRRNENGQKGVPMAEKIRRAMEVREMARALRRGRPMAFQWERRR